MLPQLQKRASPCCPFPKSRPIIYGRGFHCLSPGPRTLYGNGMTLTAPEAPSKILTILLPRCYQGALRYFARGYLLSGYAGREQRASPLFSTCKVLLPTTLFTRQGTIPPRRASHPANGGFS